MITRIQSNDCKNRLNFGNAEAFCQEFRTTGITDSLVLRFAAYRLKARQQAMADLDRRMSVASRDAGSLPILKLIIRPNFRIARFLLEYAAKISKNLALFPSERDKQLQALFTRFCSGQN